MWLEQHVWKARQSVQGFDISNTNSVRCGSAAKAAFTQSRDCGLVTDSSLSLSGRPRVSDLGSAAQAAASRAACSAAATRAATRAGSCIGPRCPRPWNLRTAARCVGSREHGRVLTVTLLALPFLLLGHHRGLAFTVSQGQHRCRVRAEGGDLLHSITLDMMTSTRLLEPEKPLLPAAGAQTRAQTRQKCEPAGNLAVPMWPPRRGAAPSTLPLHSFRLGAPLKACARQSLRYQRRGALKGAIRPSAGCDRDGAQDPVLRQRIGGHAHVAVHARFCLGRARQLAAAVWRTQD